MRKTYPVKDHIPAADLLAIGCSRRGVMRYRKGEVQCDIRAVRTGEFRSPQAGEWFLSGAEPHAYLMPNDGSGIEYHIMRLVAVRQVRYWEAI